MEGLKVGAIMLNSALYSSLDQIVLFGRDVFGSQQALITASAADREEYFGGIPFFEAPSAFWFRAEDEGIGRRFVDTVDQLFAVLGFDLGFNEVFGVVVLLKCFSRIGMVEGAEDVQSGEKRGFRRAERAHGVVLKREAEILHGAF